MAKVLQNQKKQPFALGLKQDCGLLPTKQMKTLFTASDVWKHQDSYYLFLATRANPNKYD